MADDRHLIVNADDFGQTPGVNRGVIVAHEKGIVTSASLMVRWPAVAEAAAYARARPKLDLGLHLDLGEWVVRNKEWVPLYEVVALDDSNAITGEVEAQLNRFVELIGRLPSHIDSHQHVHRYQPVQSVTRSAASRLGVPLRHFDPVVRYCGEFYGQTHDGSPNPEGVYVARLIDILNNLRPGVTELACHPGLDNDTESMYCTQRAEEVVTLCDPNVLEAVKSGGIHLCNFKSVSISHVSRPCSE